MLMWPMSHFHAGTAPRQRYLGLTRKWDLIWASGSSSSSRTLAIVEVPG